MAAFNLASKMAAKLSFQSFLSSLVRSRWVPPLMGDTAGHKPREPT